MNKVLIIGASGFLGQQLMKDLSKSFTVIGTYNSKPKDNLLKLDITNEDGVKVVLEKTKPDIILLASALTNLDTCELQPDLCKKINVLGVENIVKYSKNSKIVFLSTDYVFDGEKGDYKETDLVNPINEYGKSKLEAEKIVSRLKNYLIIRTCSLYTSDKNNPKAVNKIIEKLTKGEVVKAVTDVIASPTLIDDLSKAILTLIEKKRNGIYNVVGDSKLSWYEIANLIVKVFNIKNPQIQPCLITDFPSKLKRPKNTSLNIGKLKAEAIKMRSLEEGLEFLKRIKS